jgi:hypothetical protein
LEGSFIGIELDPGYFDIACKRIEEAWRQPRLFEEPKRKPEPAPNLFDGAAPMKLETCRRGLHVNRIEMRLETDRHGNRHTGTNGTSAGCVAMTGSTQPAKSSPPKTHNGDPALCTNCN